MSQTFAYILRRVKQPIATLGGRWVIPRPVIEVSLGGPRGTSLMMGCLDTGSNECYCRVDEANALGIDLSNAISGLHQGIDGTPFRVLYAEVRFRLSDGRTHLEWPALIGFTTAPIRFALLCFAGFLQFFTAEFEGNFERVTLSPNALFPASSA